MAYDYTYDIGLICMMNLNIGNNLANYALYQCLRNFDCSVLVIANPLNTSCFFHDVEDDRFRLFQENPYPKTAIFLAGQDKWKLPFVNLICDRFVLGSDQLWREMFIKETDFFTCLDWVESRKYKIAYATSFGTDYFEGDANIQEKVGYLLRRFQNISVREQSGVRLLKELYGIKAEYVLDPVFLCEKKYYENMAARGKQRVPQGKYVGTYLLDITDKKKKAVKGISSYMANGSYLAMTQPGIPVNEDIDITFISDAVIEEWLAMIENCDFFITDSFHGICFALIFQKQFCVIFEKENWRGMSRIQSLLDLVRLNSRLVEKCDSKKLLELCDEPIDYDRVNKILSVESKKSKSWLRNYLEKGKYYKGKYDTHDFTWELYCQLHQKLQELEKNISVTNEKHEIKSYKTRSDLFTFSHGFVKKYIGIPKGEARNMQIVGWGAGDCFRRNVSRIKKFYKLKYVCDSNPEKWGKEIEEQIVCISPKMLSEMRNIMVIIMVDNTGMAFQIVQELLEMGISNFDHVENWLAFVEGD